MKLSFKQRIEQEKKRINNIIVPKLIEKKKERKEGLNERIINYKRNNEARRLAL